MHESYESRFTDLNKRIGGVEQGLARLQVSVESMIETSHATQVMVRKQAEGRQTNWSLVVAIVVGFASTILGVIGVMALVGSMAINPLKENVQLIREDVKRHIADADHPWGVMMRIAEVKAELAALKASKAEHDDNQDDQLKAINAELTAMIKNRNTDEDGKARDEKILELTKIVYEMKGGEE